MTVEAGNVGLRQMFLTDGLDALPGECAVQLALVGGEPRSRPQQERAGKAGQQHDDHQASQAHEQQPDHQLTILGGIAGPRKPENCESGVRLRFFCFYRYMRRSASVSSFSVSVPSSGYMAHPTLSESQSSPQISRPVALASSPRQMPRASAAEALSPGATITNSSPPMRAM